MTHAGRDNSITRKRINLIMYVIAHEIWKRPGPTNIFSEEDNQTDPTHSINKVMREKANQVIVLLSTRHSLSANIHRIVNIGHMPNE
jgi:hypothetical protein